jgi:uncharacterized protein (TIGR00290 family)
MSERVLVCWSGGKDSALALHALLRAGDFEVAGLLTTVTADYGRVSLHGLRRELLARQAEALGHPLVSVELPAGGSDDEYERRMRQVLAAHRDAGVTRVVFGDLFLSEVRRRREDNLRRVGMSGLFPLWGTDTGELARRFIGDRFRAILICVDGEALAGRFAGRLFDERLLADLPDGTDPCGENGEFHTFVFDGPLFRSAVGFRTGEVLHRDGRFHFLDLLPQA